MLTQEMRAQVLVGDSLRCGRARLVAGAQPWEGWTYGAARRWGGSGWGRLIEGGEYEYGGGGWIVCVSASVLSGGWSAFLVWDERSGMVGMEGVGLLRTHAVSVRVTRSA